MLPQIARKTCSNEKNESRIKIEGYMYQIVKMEAAKLENHVIIWNAVSKDNDHAKVLFPEVVHHELEICTGT